MTSDELQQRFAREIEKRAVDDKYIDGLEERELLQIGLQHGFSTDEVRRFLVDVCAQRGYVIEAALVKRIREGVRQHLDGKGRIDRRGFDALVRDLRPAVAGTTRTDADLRRLVLTTLDDAPAARIRTGWFGNWFTRLKRQVGVA